MTKIETLAPRQASPPSGVADADAGFGVYVHWPFCLAKCPYCDFNSHVRAAPIDEERFVAALRAESPIARRRRPDARCARSSSAAARPR